MVLPVDTSLSRPWEVGALLLAAADAMQARFGAVTIRGELSGFTRAASGHCYFSLKDSQGQAALLRCAMFRRAASMLDFAPRDGLKVEVRGRLSVYEARGELQCVVEAMAPLGAGSLFELFLRLREKLKAEGLFDESRKRPIPAHPRSIGVVSSTQAAALADVLTTLRRRAPHVRVIVYPCAVQGDDAPRQIVQALRAAGQRREVDSLILCRGGGSLEDLWAFNDEAVVRAVAASPLPVICGVGHETDFTLSDLAADLRAPTPTGAAERAAPVRDDLRAALEDRLLALSRAFRRHVDLRLQRLDRCVLQIGRPAERLQAQYVRVDAAAQMLRRALAHRVQDGTTRWQHQSQRWARVVERDAERRMERLHVLAQRLEGLHPHHVLARGYAWIADDAGKPLSMVAQMSVGQTVRAILSDGQAEATLTAVRPSASQAG